MFLLNVSRKQPLAVTIAVDTALGATISHNRSEINGIPIMDVKAKLLTCNYFLNSKYIYIFKYVIFSPILYKIRHLIIFFSTLAKNVPYLKKSLLNY